MLEPFVFGGVAVLGLAAGLASLATWGSNRSILGWHSAGSKGKWVAMGVGVAVGLALAIAGVER